MARLVKPKNKFKADLTPIDTDLLIENSETLKDLDGLIGDIESSHMKIPVLLRQYLNLNAGNKKMFLSKMINFFL